MRGDEVEGLKTLGEGGVVWEVEGYFCEGVEGVIGVARAGGEGEEGVAVCFVVVGGGGGREEMDRQKHQKIKIQIRHQRFQDTNTQCKEAASIPPDLLHPAREATDIFRTRRREVWVGEVVQPVPDSVVGFCEEG